MSEVEDKTSRKPETDHSLRLSDAIHRVCDDLLKRLVVNGPIRDELGKKFEPALADLVEIEIAQLDATYGAFKVAGGKLTLNEKDISHLMSYVLEDMKCQLERDQNILSASEIQQTMEETATLFALHELRHRTQGVEKFSTVQLLKVIDGRTKISTFDVQADRDAAVAFAAAEAGDLHSEQFLETYQRALFYSVQYFFRIYPANASRPDKVCRIAALMFMLARLEIYRTLGHLTVGTAITGLSVQISEDHRAIAVFQNEPQHCLLNAANDVTDLPLMVANIANGDLDAALSQAFSIVTAIGMN